MNRATEITAAHNDSTATCIVRDAAEALRIEAQHPALNDFQRRYAETLCTYAEGVLAAARKLREALAYEEAEAEMLADELAPMVSDFADHMAAALAPPSNVVFPDWSVKARVGRNLARSANPGPGAVA